MDTTTRTDRTASPHTPAADPAIDVPGLRTLIDEFLEEQASTTPVERFARDHDPATTAVGQVHRDLVPARPPGPGQQYAFEVDLDACTGCKACVTACHSLNGLAEGESWRRVGALVGGGDLPVLGHVTAACHHCVEPGCLDGCPVDAYEKDPDTGIVKHLDDQCIGCGYCTMTCSYEVPQFAPDRGIVRKCDLCSDRLAEGEAPACAQACPTDAIRIRVVDVEEAAAAASGDTDVADGTAWPFPAPDPAHTVPTTRYRTARPLRQAQPLDEGERRPAAGHLPLVLVLVLTQASLGALVGALLVGAGRGPTGAVAVAAGSSLVLGALGVVASVAHLGRPQHAYRAVIGWRHSWLSREVVAFGAYLPLLALYVASLSAPATALLPQLLLGGLAAVAGTFGVGCSVMIYAVTGRRWWRARPTALRFAATGIAGGTTILLTALASSGAAPGTLRIAALAVTVATLATVGLEHRLARRPSDPELAATADLLAGPLAPWRRRRLALTGAGGLVGPWAVVVVAGSHPGAAAVVATGTALLLVLGEVTGRSLFFRAAAPPRMPGGRR